MLKKSNIAVYCLIALCLIFALRVVAPDIIKYSINQKLANTKGIKGHIDDIDLALFRGAYQIQGLELYLQPNIKTTPTISADEIDISMLWSALFKGVVVAKVHINSTTFSFVDEPKEQNKIDPKAKQPDTWLTLINFASPINIDEIRISETKIRLLNEIEGQQQAHYVSNIFGIVTNITNSSELSGSSVANFHLTGDLMGQAQVQLKGFINPETVDPTFDINFSMKKLPVDKIAGLIEVYTPIDIEQGTVDAAIELYTLNGKVNGYMKAGIYNPNIFTWREDIVKDNDGLFTGIYEGIIDGLAAIFESDEKGLVAFKVPIEGTINDTEISKWDAFTSLLYHAFINEYDLKVENTVPESK
ncbi:DUF748 domain-containing protein [Thalassotalea hakodatensis]|uniref:DUF748 domain-containing protein n=1 Tax=Thalassotalea hakodatensis TaxID=3030492 RepID=UPI00257252F9|nr:DUF748 domain-containing protein [Thalassotalea hakodatensis]